MADPVVPDVKYSIMTQAGNGVQTSWEFNFAGRPPGYISQSHIKAFITNDTTGVVTDVTITSGMWVGPATLLIEPAVPVGSTLTIYRDTPKDNPLVDYTNGAIINEANLDRTAEQSVYVAAEVIDKFLNVKSTSDQAYATAAQAIVDSAAAVVTADSADAKANSALNASSTAVATANSAATDASAALTTATGIDAKATEALSNSETALTTATGIDAKATTALNNSASAVTTANAASTTATQAKTTADGIALTANNALSAANAANSTANTANTNASAAVTTANGVDAKAQSALDGMAAKANNLSDLPNKATARFNLGVGNVDNTSDLNKPISTAQATINAAKVDAFTSVSGNLNSVVKSGFYRTVAGATNLWPSGTDGQLIVSRGADTISQIGICYGDSAMYVRAGSPPDVGGIGSWSAWARVCTEGPAVSWLINGAQNVGGAAFSSVKLNFNTLRFDMTGIANGNPGVNRLTPNKPGLYNTTLCVGVDLGTTNTKAVCVLYKNGVLLSQGTRYNSQGPTWPTVSALVQMNGTTDYLEAFMYTEAAGTYPIYSGYDGTRWDLHYVRSM